MATSSTFNITIDSSLSDWVTSTATQHGNASGGVYIFALLYGTVVDNGVKTEYQTTPLSSVAIMENSVLKDTSFSIDLLTDTQTSIESGKIYFIIQSVDDERDVIDYNNYRQLDINWVNARSSDYRYDSVELSMDGETGDAANLTSIEGFGIAMGLEAVTGSRGYALSGETVISDLSTAPFESADRHETVETFSAGALKGATRMVMSPTVAVSGDAGTDVPYATSDWTDYVDALKTIADQVVISGYFNGAPDVDFRGATPVTVWRNAGYFSYKLSWVEGDDGYFLLSPDENSQIQGYIKLTQDDLQSSIYSTLGSVALYADSDLSEAYDLYGVNGSLHATNVMGTGANNAWGEVLQQLTLGLSAGYFGSTGTPENGTAAIDLNQNSNWDPTYAFGNRAENTIVASGKQDYDPYAKVLFDQANSYGMQYSDALTAALAKGQPLLSTYDSSTHANVTDLNVTLFGDSATSDRTFYTAPVIYNYLAGTGSSDEPYAATSFVANGSNITLNLGTGQALLLAPGSSITFRFLVKDGTDNQVWREVTLDGSHQSLWQTWTVAYDAATGAYSVSAVPNTDKTPGALVLNNIPMAASGVTWYQITVDDVDGNAIKTFNLYTTTGTPEGSATPYFVDFSDDPALFAIDGLASIAAGGEASYAGYLQTFSVNLTGTTPTFGLDHFVPNTDQSYLSTLVKSTVPVVGTLEGGAFTAAAGQTAAIQDANAAYAGIDVSYATAVTGDVAYGWTGLNAATTDVATWIEHHTNLVSGNTLAVVDIVADGRSVVRLAGTADVGGAWQTGAYALGNGTYSVSMTSYLPVSGSDAPFVGPTTNTVLSNASATLTLRVDLEALTLREAADGTALELEARGETQGNWIHVTASETPPAGTTLILYTTDADGRLVGADGTLVDSLRDATVGKVGAVSNDTGALLATSAQSVYLKTGLELHFAVESGNGAVDTDACVALTATEGGGYGVDVGGIKVQAAVDNDLSATDLAAGVQRTWDMPLVYLTQGETLSVDLSGSAANINTLGFAPVAFDTATGTFSVSGVAFGDTDAFHAAVVAALDPGFSQTLGGGDFTRTESWVVSGPTGFYTPVLQTQNGNIFVVGSAANPGGLEHIRTYGANSFGFEDLAYDENSDYDYNDMVMTLTPVVSALTGAVLEA